MGLIFARIVPKKAGNDPKRRAAAQPSGPPPGLVHRYAGASCGLLGLPGW